MGIGQGKANRQVIINQPVRSFPVRPRSESTKYQNEGEFSMFHIIKASRIYGGYGYCGPTCDKVGVEKGKTYLTLADAIADANKLKTANAIGFQVVSVKTGHTVYST